MKCKTLFLGASSAPFAAWPGCGDHRFCDLAGDRCCTAALEGLLPATLLLKSLPQLLATLADEKGREMSIKKEKRFIDRRDLSLFLSHLTHANIGESVGYRGYNEKDRFYNPFL